MKQRLVELDILRGLSILGMILVITPGNWSKRFNWMNHAEWRGYPLSDMIFPTFLFCVGMAIVISFNSRTNQQKSTSQLFVKIVKRTILLILIGLIINGFPFYDLTTIRIPGVLQRIALSYFITGSLWIIFKKTIPNKIEFSLLISGILILILYYILLYHIPIPSIGITGVSSSNSWPAFIDQNVFGIHHLWPYGTTEGKVTYDPEGILASFPASVNIIFGILVGSFHLKNNNLYNFPFLIGFGLIIMLIALGLDFFEIMPIIKKIWTSSFVLLSSGFSILTLGIVQLLIHYLPKTKKLFFPFIVYGANAILAFAVSNMLIPIFEFKISDLSIREIGYQFLLRFISNEKVASLSFSIIFLVLLYWILKILYNKKIFLKI